MSHSNVVLLILSAVTLLLSLFPLPLSGEILPASGACGDPWPPCFSIYPCPQLCGNKTRWPELVGVDGKKAKAIIEQENPGLGVWLLPPHTVPTHDYCCNRVIVLTGEDGRVTLIPILG